MRAEGLVIENVNVIRILLWPAKMEQPPGYYPSSEAMDVDETGMMEEQSTEKVDVVHLSHFPDDFDDDDLE